jgi:hypothetical protein
MATNESSKYKLSVAEGTEYKLSVVDGTELQLSLSGSAGPAGPSNVLSIGTVTTGETGTPAAASITGSSPTQTLNLTLPKGNTGATGSQGVQGIQGIQGPQGLAGDKYQTTSSTNLLIPAIGSTITITVGTGLSYSTNQNVLISHDIGNHIHAEIDSYNPTTGVMVAVVTDTDGSGTYSSWSVNLSGAVGAVGPQGIQGTQGTQGVQGIQGIAGPNTVTTSTTTNLTGYIFGNGTNISGATAAASADTANTLVIRNSSGGASFRELSSSSTTGTGASFNSLDGIASSSNSGFGTGAVSSSGSGTYHHRFGDSTGDNRSAVERVRGWFVWFFGSFTGRLKTADITADREWTLPDQSGTLTLDSHTHANATTTSAGFMSSSDKTKLNNIGMTDVVINGVTFGRGAGDVSTNTASGAEALNSNTTGSSNTAVGYRAMKANVSGISNTAVGQDALSSSSIAGHNTAIGFRSMYSSSGANNTAVGSDSLGISSGNSNTAVGYYALKNNQSGTSNTSIGSNALSNNTSGSDNIAIGQGALYYTESASNNVVIGSSSMVFSGLASDCVAVGTRTLIYNNGVVNTACGHWALTGCTTGLTNSAFGGYCLTNLTTFSNCTGLGFNAQVTGSNQVQLGNSDTTAYSYGAVQNRSDLRDKADIRDTELGLDFIDALRPVDYKWDMREDYRQEAPESVIKPTEISEDASDEDKAKYAEELAAYESYVVAKDQWLEESQLANITHDGSKKRSRYHHGLIAQEVKAVLDQQGIDFGGFQDHSLKGGDDVLSIGYVELIAPMIKAIQELKYRVEELESR